MLNKKIVLSLLLITQNLVAAEAVELHQAPVSSLNQFPTVQAKQTVEPNSLIQVNQTKEPNKTTVRYQQLYKGIPVIGAQVMVTKASNQGFNTQGKTVVNGHLQDEIDINIKPAFSSQEALDLAKKSYFNTSDKAYTHEEVSELQIRPDEQNELKLVYLVSFKSLKENKPTWPFFVIDAQNTAIIKQWNNIKTFEDNGPGGNEKVHQYWYGKDGLPGLDVLQIGGQCFMDNGSVRLVHVHSAWDWNNTLMLPFEYPCANNQGDPVNGGFSPANDAYYFGHTIVAMYKNWYGLNALQQANGEPMKLIMRVHFGQSYDNAFWDGLSMSFGDGQAFYPLVSLDVAGHEVTHGFTEQHSGLEYHDQSGALNESMSDMAGQASKAYLLETNPLLYNKAYLTADKVTWGIGETIVRDAFGKALRFMDFPSSDGSSADCLDKNLAVSSGAYCAISYAELQDFANTHLPDPQSRQSFIVHTASGIFNKAFYLLSNNLGIKKAYHLMIIANTKYWTPATNFSEAACGVIYAAKDLNVPVDGVQSVFNQVGVSTELCVK